MNSGSEMRAPLRIAREVLGERLTLPRIRWGAVRGGRRVADVSVPAAAAVLVEIARATEPVGDAGDAPFVRYSVRNREGATRFSRSTVSTALAAVNMPSRATTPARARRTHLVSDRPQARLRNGA